MIPTLRDYQIEIITELAQAKNEDGFKAPLIVSPTGSGKTIMFAFVSVQAEAKQKRVLILVHRIEILNQTVKSLLEFGVQAGTIASGRPMTSDLIQVAMISTLVHRMDQIIAPDVIITDEAHHSTAGQWMKLQKKYPEVFRAGFTATPERADGEGLINCFDTMIEGPTTRWLVEQGFLTLPRVFIGPDVEEKPKNLHVKMGDYDKKEQFQKKRKRTYVGNVIDHYKKHLDGLPVVCFCVNIEHCELMEAEFRSYGYRASTVHGKMKKPERDAAIGGLSTGEVQVICSCDVISEGVDVPVIAGVILLRRTKSLGLYLQQVGRALRPVYPEGADLSTKESRLAAIARSIKPWAIVLDHSGCYYEHGHPIAERNWSLFSKKRNKRDKVTPPEITVCPRCGGAFEGIKAVCPACGYDIDLHKLKASGKRTPEEIKGILTEVMEPGTTPDIIAALTAQAETIQKMSPADRQRAMQANLHRYGKDSDRIKGLAKIAGYKENWSHSVYKRISK